MQRVAAGWLQGCAAAFGSVSAIGTRPRQNSWKCASGSGCGCANVAVDFPHRGTQPYATTTPSTTSILTATTTTSCVESGFNNRFFSGTLANQYLANRSSAAAFPFPNRISIPLASILIKHCVQFCFTFGWFVDFTVSIFVFSLSEICG